MEYQRKNRRTIGSEYEERAAQYLKEQGWVVLERNYRCRQGEIDIIARDGDCLVFVEVKYRRSTKYGDPAEAVTPAKQKRIIRTALFYIGTHHRTMPACRFDVIGILGEKLTHYQNAFSAS